MPFSAGSALGFATINTAGWESGVAKMNASSATLNKGFSKVKAGMLVAGAVIVAGLAVATKKAHEFNKEFANVTTLIDTAVVNTKRMRSELLALDSRLGSAKELTKGLYQAISASVKPAEAVKFVGEAAIFAKAALTDTFSAVDVLTTALNAYGLEASEVTRISDVLFQTIKRGKVTGQELATSIGAVIPIAATTGVNIEQLGAALVIMTRQGIKANKASIMLRQVISSLLKPSLAMTMVLKEYGFESGDAMLKTLGLQGTMALLSKEAGGSAAAMARLIPNVRAMTGVLALTNEGASDYADVLKEMSDVSGVTTEAFEKQELTLETLKNSVDKAAIKIGSELLPSVLDVASGFTDWVNEGRNVEAVTIVITSTLKSLADIGDSLTEFFENLKGEIEIATITFTPLEVVLKGVASVMLILGKAIAIQIEFWSAVISMARDFGAILGEVWAFIKGDKTFEEAWTNIKDIAEQSFDDIIERAANFEKDLVNDMVGIWTKTEDATREGVDKFLSEAERMKILYDEIVNGIIKSNTNLAQSFKDISDDTKENMKDMVGEVLKHMRFWLDAIDGFTSSAEDLISQQFKNELSELKIKGQKESEELESRKQEKLDRLSDETEQTLATLQSQRDRNIISEEEFEAKKAALFRKQREEKTKLEEEFQKKDNNRKEKQRKKENKIKEKQFNADKGLRIAQLWIQTASAIVAIWASSFATIGNPIAAAIVAAALSTVMTGIAIAQTVAIAKQKYVPSAATGAKVTRAGLINTDESGGEIKKFARGDIIVPNDISRRIADKVGLNRVNTGGRPILIDIHDNRINDEKDIRKIANAVDVALGRALRRVS